MLQKAGSEARHRGLPTLPTLGAALSQLRCRHNSGHDRAGSMDNGPAFAGGALVHHAFANIEVL